ncbi:MAG: SulP family inorganic anion transporter [Paracoccus sp. (in: a-proteobacteria)]|nr:SulP family inorganic anion transporter [Paracoccus sp. (in: a-proteobacteria)]
MRYRPAFLETTPGLKDLQAGLTVAIVALPLSLAIAIASGVPPDRGLVTAIIGGFLVSALGGTRHQIGGPAGAFIVLVSGCVSAIGLDGLILATCLSGIMLVILGMARLGGAIRFVPYPVILGFTAGIAVIIAASQLADFLGLDLTAPEPDGFLPKLAALWVARDSLHLPTFGVAALTVGTIVLLQHIAPRLPVLLIGVIVATLAGLVLPVETIQDRFGNLPAGLPMPVFPIITPESVRAAMPFALAFTLLGAIESLLSAMVADQMSGSRMRPDDELIGQGLANIGAGLFGGFCTTGTIARTATNVKAGSRGPGSGMIHAGLLLLFLIVAAPVLGAIPLAGLAGLLMVVAWKMIEWHAIGVLLRFDRSEAGVSALTFLAVILGDLTLGIAIGTALSGLLFIARMARDGDARPVNHDALAADQMLLHLTGPLFFGSVARIERALDRTAEQPRLIILEMSGVTLLDRTGVQMLQEFSVRAQRRGSRVVLLVPDAAMAGRFPAALSVVTQLESALQ